MTEEKLAYVNRLNREIREIESLLSHDFIGFYAHNRDTANVEYRFCEITMNEVLKTLNDRLEILKKEFEEL